jgi:succinoglycan biosynthesis protein ExoM
VTAIEPICSVSVAALTFQRPEGLQTLLDAWSALELPTGVRTEFVIVDNDPAGTAESTVANARLHGQTIRYAVEAQRGISAARNRAVELSRDCDALVFIDDDEWPVAGWLTALISTLDATGAAAVLGPVVPHYEASPPAWVQRGRFFERLRVPTGTAMNFGYTSNVIVRMASVPEHEPFDLRFGLTGGGDTHFFNGLMAAGGTIVFCDEAVVSESIPASRMTERWLVQRFFRRGLTQSMSLRANGFNSRRLIRRLGNAGLSVAKGIVVAARAVVEGRQALVRGAQHAAYGVGLVVGLVSSGYEEYRTVHGS